MASQQTCPPSQVRVPPEWTSSNFSSLACALPDCGNNRAALQECCVNGQIESFVPGSSIDNEYLSCAITPSNGSVPFDPLEGDPSPYLDYQNCLLQNEAEYFRCNQPNGQTLNDCPVGMPSSPASGGDMTCETRNLPNATDVLRECCTSDLQAYGYGCYAWCSGNTTLQECVDLRYGRDDGPAIFCGNSSSASSDGDESYDGGAVNVRPLSVLGWLTVAAVALGLQQTW